MSLDVEAALREAKLDGHVVVEDVGEYVVVKPRGYLGDVWHPINALLWRRFNFQWVSEGKQSRWHVKAASIKGKAPTPIKEPPKPQFPIPLEQATPKQPQTAVTVQVQKTEEQQIEETIKKVKKILNELHLSTFLKYRQAGLEIIVSGFKKGKWKSEVRKKALKKWAIAPRTLNRIIRLGEMTETEFRHVVAKFPSVHAWANQPKEITQLEPLPEGPFDVIYADPPWKYYVSHLRANPEKYYQTMTVEEITNIKIPSSENAVLFLWATNPMLEDALKVMEAWGFEYKTNMVWVKDKFGTGFYVRGQHELLLIGVKGDVHPPEESSRVSSVLHAPVKEHSQKPTEVYEIIEKMYPKAQFLELFARQKREGWEAWGNEV